MENIDAPLRIDSLIIQKSFFKINFLKSVPDTVITLWRQEKRSFEGQYILTENNGQTVLNWTLHFHIKLYPWEKLASMFYDKQLGPIMEKSLLNLRNEMENPG